MIFFSHTDPTLLRRGAVPQRAIVRCSYRLGLLGVLIIFLSVLFMIIPKGPIIIDTMDVLRCHMFSISISRFLYLLIL